MASSAADEDPPADGFGQDGVTWRPSANHDPTQIAALHLQHRLVTVARQAWSRVHPGSALTGANFAKVLNTSLRPAEKRLAGQQPLQLIDIVRLAFYLGDEILVAVPRGVRDLFPEAYRPLLGSWEAGSGTPPTFRSDLLGSQLWVGVIAQLAEYLNTEASAGRDHLLTTDAVTYALVQALDTFGVDPGTIEFDDRPPPDTATRALLIGPHTNATLATVAYLPDQAESPRVLDNRLGRILYGTAGRVDHGVLIMVAGRAAARRLRTHLPEVVDSPSDTQTTLTYPTLSPIPSPGDVPDDLGITVLARQEHQDRHVTLALLIAKR